MHLLREIIIRQVPSRGLYEYTMLEMLSQELVSSTILIRRGIVGIQNLCYGIMMSKTNNPIVVLSKLSGYHTPAQ